MSLMPHRTSRLPRGPGEVAPGADAGEAAASLLAWYDRHRRDLPWRAPPGASADPYAVWVSEIMLQQTTAAAVTPYFRAFLVRWRNVADLAAADLDDVLHAWQGLGYYARARNLHACARAVVAEHAGRFPDEETALRRLPGIGAYTAAAIAAIAFDRPATPVDANVLRVVARLHAVETPLPAARSELAALAAALTPRSRPGDFAQAMMDLGATLCAPRRPRCAECPWREGCRAHALGAPERYPLRAEKGEKPVRRGVVFWATRPDGSVLLQRRPKEGLLGGLMEFPSTPWRAEPWREDDALAQAPVAAGWTAVPGVVRHTFTHFHLELHVVTGRCAADAGPRGATWCRPEEFAALALPTLMKKVARLVHDAESAPMLPIGQGGKIDRDALTPTRRRRPTR